MGQQDQESGVNQPKAHEMWWPSPKLWGSMPKTFMCRIHKNTSFL